MKQKKKIIMLPSEKPSIIELVTATHTPISTGGYPKDVLAEGKLIYNCEKYKPSKFRKPQHLYILSEE
jgi:hypothetical protein